MYSSDGREEERKEKRTGKELLHVFIPGTWLTFV